MKICTKCKENKQLEEYQKQSKSKDGLQSKCRKCCAIYKKEHYITNRDKEKVIQQVWYQENKEKRCLKSKIYRETNQEQVSIYHKNRYIKNKEEYNAASKFWRKSNSAKRAAYEAMHRAIKLQTTPKWLTEEHNKQIEFIYKMANTIQKLTSITCHVDHIIPLKGKIVSGLHIPYNLQITTAEFNIKKNNKLL